MNVVCDTNIWYELGNGTIDASQLKRAGYRLTATGLNAIELGSRITDKTFPARKAAAQAVIDHADDHLRDPDYHLADLWQLNSPQRLDWKPLYPAIAQSRDFSDVNGKMDIQAA